ncbi:MAG: DUF3017 domain-containing protein [Jatrophihabitantaceae bacterium]
MSVQRLRWLRAELPFVEVVVVALSSVGYLLVWPDHWRRGVGLIALAMIAAGVLRLTLSPARAGSLAVRGRGWDVACYLAIGVVILVVEIRLH